LFSKTPGFDGYLTISQDKWSNNLLMQERNFSTALPGRRRKAQHSGKMRDSLGQREKQGVHVSRRKHRFFRK